MPFRWPLTPARSALLLIAAALLVVALAGPVQRAWQARTNAAAAKALAEQVAREREALAAELAANRPQIIAGLREQLRTGDHAGAMKAAAKFAPLKDPEVNDVFRKAAAAVSAKQAVDGYRALVQRDCTEANVRYQLAHLLDGDPARGSPPPPLEYGELKISRVTGSDASVPVVARLREPQGRDPPPADADWITRVRAYTQTHVLPDYLAALMTESGHDVICVWRIEGTRIDQRRGVPFTMLLWLPPTRDGKGLRPDPLAYSERAS